MDRPATRLPRRALFFLLLFSALVLAAGLAARHPLTLDLSARKAHTLSATARQALDRLQAPLELVAFVPDLRMQRTEYRRLLSPYLQHPQKPRLTFVDPVASPDQARQHGMTRQGELHLVSDGRREVLSTPTRNGMELALNRLALRGERWIVSLKGQGERAIDNTPGGIGRLAAQADALGYRMIGLDPRQVGQLPNNTAVLLVAGPDRPYDEATRTLISAYLDDGGRILWMLGGPMPRFLKEIAGVDTLPGTIVDAAAARHGLDSPNHAIVTGYPAALLPRPPKGFSTLQNARALVAGHSDRWQSVAALRSGPQSWNETGELRGRIGRDPADGEQAGPLNAALALETTGQTPVSRLVLIGSQDAFTNAQLGQGHNRELALGLLHWLSDNTALLATPAKVDLDIHWSPELGGAFGVILMGLLPLAYLATGLLLRWRRRRA